MTRPRFDPVVHEPTRLQMCGVLVAVAEAEFATLRDSLRLADSVTSKHHKALEHAGYVRLTKRRPAVGRPRTWVKLTREGRRAFEGHVAELQRLASLAAAGPPTGRDAVDTSPTD